MSASPVNRFALVDVDSFFVACERIFHPRLVGRPVVVLSNNDGCVISRSVEAKKLGIEMGVPWFKIKAWAERTGVVARSSNYELYGSISARTMALLGTFTSQVEVYSVDEAFLKLHGEPRHLGEMARNIQRRILHDLGIPVSVGLAPTRTLAKLACHGAKSSPSRKKVVSTDAYTQDQLDAILEATAVGELWGVGRRIEARLEAMRITNARQLRDADEKKLRHQFSVNLARTILELRGIACIAIQDNNADRTGQIIFSRSFSTPVTTATQLHQVVSIYAQNVTRRLRAQHYVAGSLWGFAATSWHTQPFHRIAEAVNIAPRTDDPIVVLNAVSPLLLSRMEPGRRYVRAGICLSDLAPADCQPALPGLVPDCRGAQLGALVDKVNAAVGRDAVGLGLAGLQAPPDWQMRRQLLSNRGTTHWSELTQVAAH